MSGRKDSLAKYQIVTAGDMSGNVTSLITNIQFMDNIGIQLNITSGTPSGTFDVQVSADHFEVNKVVVVPGTFISLGTPYRATIVSGSPSSVYFDLTQLSAPYVQLLYTRSGGSGTFNAYIVGKMI